MATDPNEQEPQHLGHGDAIKAVKQLHIDTALAQTNGTIPDLVRTTPTSPRPSSRATSVSSKSSSTAPIRPIHPNHMLSGEHGVANWGPAPKSPVRNRPIPMPLPYLPLRKATSQRLRQKHSPLNEGGFPRAEQPSPKLPTASGWPSESNVSNVNNGDGTRSTVVSKTVPHVHEKTNEPTRFPPRKSSLHRERGASFSSHVNPAEKQPALPLRAATSIPELSRKTSNKGHIGPCRYQPGLVERLEDRSLSPLARHPLPELGGLSDEVRASVRSAETYESSGFIDASETERSSVVTTQSFSKGPCGGFAHQDDTDSEGMSVEDAITMYADGFGDDEEDVADSGRAPSDEGYFSQAHLSSGADGETPLAEPRGRSTNRTESGYFESDSHLNEGLPQRTPHQAQTSTETTAEHHKSISPGPVRVIGPVPRDRYGFKKSTPYITEEQYDEWNGPYTEYLERRRKKWELLMKHHHLPTENPTRFPSKSDKIKRYIRKGIPPEWRGAAWFWYAGGPARLAKNEGLYWELVEQVGQGKLRDQDREHIERDLHRSFPDNIRFKPDPTSARDSATGMDSHHPSLEPETAMLRSLRRVLQAFAIHNPSIGYCQSLNFLAGLLLLFLNEDEEKAFILLNIITNEHLPGSHARVLEANVDIGVLMSCIRESMPTIWAKVDDVAETAVPSNQHITTTSSRLPTVSLATTAWFMSCFVGNLPIETVLRVWDSFFYEGSKTLFRIALTVFKIGEPEIRAVNDHMEIFQVVQTIPRRLIDSNGLMETCYKRRNGFGHLSQETIDMRRADRRRAHKEDVARLNGAATMPAHSEKASGMKRSASRARFKRAISKRRPTEP